MRLKIREAHWVVVFWRPGALGQHQQRPVGIGTEAFNDRTRAEQHAQDLARGAVAAPKPNDFGWVAPREAEDLEIVVLRGDGESAALCKGPDRVVVAPRQIM